MALPTPKFVWLPIMLGFFVTAVAAALVLQGSHGTRTLNPENYYPDICLSLEGCCPDDGVEIDGQRMCPRN